MVEKVNSKRLREVAERVEDDIDESMPYCDFPTNTGLMSASPMLLNGWTEGFDAALM